jgi:hypothetical protein
MPGVERLSVSGDSWAHFAHGDVSPDGVTLSADLSIGGSGEEVSSGAEALVLDYVARQKAGGTQLDYFIIKQLPIIPPRAYTPDDLLFTVRSRVLELSCTAWDLKPFAQDCGYDGEPFGWDEHRRAVVSAELDAYYAAMYGLTRDELRYLLDPTEVYGPGFPGETFRVLKEREIKQYGEYRTHRLVLDAWDRLGLQPRNRDGRYDAGPQSRLTDTASVSAHAHSTPLLAAQTVREWTRIEARSMPMFPTEQPPKGL